MLVELDRESGAARLDDEGLEALLDAARGDGAAGHPDAVAALASGRLDEILAATQRPLVTVDLVVASAATLLSHRAWVVPDTAALLLGVRPGLHQLMAVPPAYLTSALSRLTRLKPRRVEDRADVPFPTDRLGELVAADQGLRAAALADAGAELAWRLQVDWAEGRQELTATDGPGGVHLAEPGGELLRAVTNTTLYRVLSTALPRDALPAD